ncbi:MAG: twitching motility protein PilT [Gammaproteobacteria bacterium RIFCSPLOWO2_02_FULL_61_13]|nr:MAG: twitching motility protein PilT [Gammaproteobacteria bacterium RIFCSPLOWO2_02_FULL_61_13]
MKLLLDTHALLWWWKDDPRLSKRAAAAIADEGNSVFVSAASAWEIATKHRIGKLPGAESAVREFNELIIADGFGHLAVSYHHALMAGGFDSKHRDPFDRMLAAQSLIEGATLVTDDNAMKLFRIKCFW